MEFHGFEKENRRPQGRLLALVNLEGREEFCVRLRLDIEAA
jgi:hypothetical protein